MPAQEDAPHGKVSQPPVGIVAAAISPDWNHVAISQGSEVLLWEVSPDPSSPVPNCAYTHLPLYLHIANDAAMKIVRRKGPAKLLNNGAPWRRQRRLLANST